MNAIDKDVADEQVAGSRSPLIRDTNVLDDLVVQVAQNESPPPASAGSGPGSRAMGSRSYTSGDDVIYGTMSSEKILCGDGNDKVYASSGNDTVLGGAGNDSLHGELGNDHLDGGPGADTMRGGPGNDRYVVNHSGDIIVETGYDRLDRVDTTVSFSLRSLSINILSAQYCEKNIQLTGNHQGNLIVGGSGRNLLDGASGHDRIEGGAGADTLVGGIGIDELHGGRGADRFDFNSVSESRPGMRDTIEDFRASDGDRIDLRDVDLNGSRPGLGSRFDFIGSALFSGEAGELRYDGLRLQGDVNGDRHVDFEIRFLSLSTPLLESHILL